MPSALLCGGARRLIGRYASALSPDRPVDWPIIAVREVTTRVPAVSTAAVYDGLPRTVPGVAADVQVPLLLDRA